MKKVLTALLLLVTMLSLVACGNSSTSTSTSSSSESKPTISGTLEEILSDVYSHIDADDDTKAYLGRMATTPIANDDNTQKWYFGVSGLVYKEAIASEPMMTSQAFSVMLIRANSASDVAALKKSISDNISSCFNKWICVSVESATIEAIDDVIIVIMNDELASALQTSFLSLAK